MIAAVFCAGVALASEEEVVVTTGKDRGAYFYVGARLTTAMFVAHKRPVKVLTSRGSIENLERLDDPNHPAAVGLTQADALKGFKTSCCTEI